MEALRHGRTPRQERARLRVERVLTGAAEVFAEVGYARATTNHIATRAGVHVPSVYQYFSNKDSILAELWDRHVGVVIDMLSDMLREPDAAPIAATARSYVAAVLELHMARPKLLAELYAEAPKLDNVRNLQAEAIAVLVPYMEHHASSLHTSNHPLTAFVLVASVEGVARHAVVTPDLPTPALVDELTSLVCLYLGVS